MDRRETAVFHREAAVQLREKILHARLKVEKTKAEGLERKADLTRATNEKLVVAVVEALAKTAEDRKDLAELSYVANHDALTALPNRSLLQDRLERAIVFAGRHGQRAAVIYLDLDHFKAINDTLGHAVGDLVLQATATRLLACVRVSDTVCRQGGDEFLVLLPECDAPDDALLVARKLINAMAVPLYLGGHRVRVTLSVGISLFPEDGCDAETLVCRADQAMYQAKEAGGNRSCGYQEPATT